MISVCAIRSKTRVIFGTRFGTRVPNSTNYVPNGSYILLKYKTLPNSVLSYWKIYVILHRKVRWHSHKSNKPQEKAIKQLYNKHLQQAVQKIIFAFF